MIALIIVLVVAAMIFCGGLFSFYYTFFCGEKNKISDKKFIDKKIIDEKFVPIVTKLIDELINLPFISMQIKSYDGLTLKGNFYELKKGAPVIIFFHGYRSSMYFDCCGAYRFAKNTGCNFLLCSHRAHGVSEGKVITFGIRESKDVLSWIKHINNEFSSSLPIILYGISMGASAVMMSTALNLPPNVKGICADCGFSSAKDVIKRRIEFDMKLPTMFFYPFVYIGALLFGGFSLEKTSAEKALNQNNIPIIFLHGEKDDIVPIEMGIKDYKANKGIKKFVRFKNATHGTSYLYEPLRYTNEITEFIKNALEVDGNRRFESVDRENQRNNFVKY